MKCRVIGISEVKSGNYQGHDYTNQYLYVVTDERTHVGTKTDKLKVNPSLLPANLSVNDEIHVLFNRYGNVDSIHKV